MSAHDSCQHSPSSSLDELVLVVHGVGDPKPGETLSLFARSVAEANHPLTEHQETLWLQDEADSPRDVKTFATHVRHLEFDGNRSTLAEVYWGDLSRVNRGLFGVLSGLIQILFGLKYVSFVASHQKGIASKGLQWLGLISSRILHGPVLAVNFVLAIMMIAVAVTESLWQGSSLVSDWACVLILGGVIICLSASFLGWRLTRNSISHRFWYWVMMTSLFMTGLVAFAMVTQLNISLVGYCSVMVTMLGAQWIMLIVAMLVMLLFWLFAMFQSSVYRPALNVALILPALTVGAWGLAIPLMWVTGSNAIIKALPNKGQTTFAPIKSIHASHNHGVPTSNDATDLGRADSNNTHQNGTLESANTVRAQFATMFEKAAPLIGVQCIMLLFVAIIAIIQLGRYIRWSERSSIADYRDGKRAPRLIVNEAVQFCIAGCAVTGMIMALYVSLHEFSSHRHLEDNFCCILVEANKYAIAFLLPIGGLLLFSLHLMKPALDIILDVTNHFYFRSATSADRVRGFAEDFDIDDVTFNGGELYYSRRDVIHRRIKRILEHYRNTLPGNPTLTIVSHSQGSMIAIEVMNDDELDWVNQKFRQVNFITMGSPFQHIYQQYFQHFYPPLDHKQWTKLRSRVSRWLNIFRIDDFVGTEIDFPETLDRAQSGDYTNHAVERKGHMLYWCDRQVLAVIRQHDICRSLSSVTRISRRNNEAA